jgi:hypothetical protein
MTEQTGATIRAAMSIDTTITPEEEKHLRRALGERRGKQSRTLITTTEACEILECNPVTLRRYENRGLITAIRYSQRKIRWDRDDVLELRDNGIPIEEGAA